MPFSPLATAGHRGPRWTRITTAASLTRSWWRPSSSIVRVAQTKPGVATAAAVAVAVAVSRSPQHLVPQSFQRRMRVDRPLFRKVGEGVCSEVLRSSGVLVALVAAQSQDLKWTHEVSQCQPVPPSFSLASLTRSAEWCRPDQTSIHTSNPTHLARLSCRRSFHQRPLDAAQRQRQRHRHPD